jgi:hypothetical protein
MICVDALGMFRHTLANSPPDDQTIFAADYSSSSFFIFMSQPNSIQQSVACVAAVKSVLRWARAVWVRALPAQGRLMEKGG